MRMWAPSADEVDHARRVIAAFDAAVADGKGVVTVDGRMIENLHVDNARRVARRLQRANRRRSTEFRCHTVPGQT
jgi:citrate lyase beta subunit